MDPGFCQRSIYPYLSAKSGAKWRTNNSAPVSHSKTESATAAIRSRSDPTMIPIRAVDRLATRRLRQWFWRKHKVRSGRYVRYSDNWLRETCGLTHLGPTTRDLPWAKA